MRRRDMLVRLGLGAASVVVSPSTFAGSRVRPDRGARLAEEIAAASTEQALRLVAGQRFRIEPGTRRPRSSGRNPHARFGGPATIAGAAQLAAIGRHSLDRAFCALFEAGVLEVRPTPVDGKIHAVLLVPSVRDSGPDASIEAWSSVLWTTLAVKRAQDADRAEGDWQLPPRHETKPANLRKAMRTFDDAMERWDAEAADAALIGVLHFVDAESLFHALWSYGARCFVNDGRKIVLAAQVHRHLRSSCANTERALRWLVKGLLYAPDATGPQTAVYVQSRRRLTAVPVDWQDNEERPGASADILGQLRGRSSGDAQEVVVAALRRGIGPDTVWDALSLYAAEVALHRPAESTDRPEHALPLIEVGALRYAARHAWHPITRKLMLLQAAGWLPLLRDRAIAVGGPLAGVDIESLGVDVTERGGTLQDALATRSPALTRIRLDESPRPLEIFGRQFDEYFLPRCTGPLQYQYVFAAFRVAEAVDRRWQSRILAPIVRSIPALDADETEDYRTARDALK